MLETWIKILWIPTLLTLIMLVLKLTGLLLVTWWWVFSPLLIVLGWLFIVGTVAVGVKIGNDF